MGGGYYRCHSTCVSDSRRTIKQRFQQPIPILLTLLENDLGSVVLGESVDLRGDPGGGLLGAGVNPCWELMLYLL